MPESNIRKRTQARECVLQILYQCEMNDTSLEETFENYWQQNPGHGREIKTFAEDLVRGTFQYLSEINEVINRYAQNWELDRMAVIDRSILRFASYEILYRDDIPPKVTINEAVNIAKKYSQQDSGKFVNGILDKINHSEGNRRPAS